MHYSQMKDRFWSLQREDELTVTADHLKLLRHARVSWREGELDLNRGAPTIDPHCPYGSDRLYEDMARILGLADAEWRDELGHPTETAKERLAQLHVETAIALQIVLATGEFRTGHYRNGDDFCRWQRTGD